MSSSHNLGYTDFCYAIPTEPHPPTFASPTKPTAAVTTELHAAADHQPYLDFAQLTPRLNHTNPARNNPTLLTKLSLTRVSFTELPSSVAPQWYDWNHTTNDGRRLYRRPPVPALSATDAAWADGILNPLGGAA